MIKSWYNRLNKISALKRLALVFFSNILTAFGISCFYACGLGSDPISVFVDGQHRLTGLTLGQINTIDNVILLILMLLLARRYFNVGTLVTVFLTGPLIDLFFGFLSHTFPENDTTLPIKIAMISIGILLFCFGLSLFITADFGIGTFDFPSLALSDKTGIEMRWFRMALDALFLVTGYLMGGKAGFGTVAGVLTTGPLLSFFLKRLKEPLAKILQPLYRDATPSAEK